MPLLVVLLLTLGTGFAAGLTLRGRSASDAVTPAAPTPADATPTTAISTRPGTIRNGPWGDLRVTRIVTEPLEAAAAALVPSEPTRWVLPQQSPVGVERLLVEAGMNAGLVAKIAPTITWDATLGASIVKPDAATVMAIPAKVRSDFYATLARYPVNEYQTKPFRFRQSQVDQWFEASRLSDSTVSILRTLAYTRGDTVLIADVPAACEQIADPVEKARMLKVLSRTSTLMVDLMIKPDSDIDALTDYWGFGKRLRDVRPLLESLTRVPGGISMDIVHLLPRFARKRLYAYPARDGRTLDLPYDCHWSSLNFWNDPPDDRLSDTAYVAQTLMSEYQKVPEGQWRFGDVVLLGESEDQLIHSCVYVADDIVFTKNGPSHLTPWVLMEFDDLLAYYEMPGRSAMRAYRLKELMRP